MIDSVECGFQVRVQYPHPVRTLAGHRGEDDLDRVMAAATWPEPVLPGVQPGLPFGFQRVTHPGLLGAVGDGRNPQWPFSAFLRNVHSPHRQRLSPTAPAV